MAEKETSIDKLTVPPIRIPEHAVHPLFPARWSPRAMSGEPITREELMVLLEAARWAPSNSNNQPWRFIYSMRGSPSWERFVGLMNEGNRIWAKEAAVLIVVASKTTFDYNEKPDITHSFDAGAAWANLAHQASIQGLVAHGMAGFDYLRAAEELKIPDGYQVEAMIAIGRHGLKEDLPLKLQEREIPSGRKHTAEIAFEGEFGNQQA